MGRLDQGDQATAEKPRRYQRDRPGELTHVEVTKLTGIPDGGGWRIRGRGCEGERAAGYQIGYRYLHNALSERTRLRLLRDPRRRASRHRSRVLATRRSLVRRLRHQLRTRHHRQRVLLPLGALAPRLCHHRQRDTAHLPQTNGNAERYHRVLPEGVGLCPPLDLRSEAPHRLRQVRSLRQSPPLPPRTRLGNPPRHAPTGRRGRPPRCAPLARTGVVSFTRH